jgi:hypothetical protein
MNWSCHFLLDVLILLTNSWQLGLHIHYFILVLTAAAIHFVSFSNSVSKSLVKFNDDSIAPIDIKCMHYGQKYDIFKNSLWFLLLLLSILYKCNLCFLIFYVFVNLTILGQKYWLLIGPHVLVIRCPRMLYYVHMNFAWNAYGIRLT